MRWYLFIEWDAAARKYSWLEKYPWSKTPTIEAVEKYLKEAGITHVINYWLEEL